MIQVISHRGNLIGPDKDRENTEEAIILALTLGYAVEIDIWVIDGVFYLGHDGPERLLTREDFLTDARIYVHAKNVEAVRYLSAIDGCQWFWHENDHMTITSTGKIWCFPGVNSIPGSIVLDLGDHRINPEHLDARWYGICTDYPKNFDTK